jgi:3-hydroxyacyl-[acyl-carrier-protein] dehydratase
MSQPPPVTDRLPSAGDLAAEFLPHAPPFLLLDRIVSIDGTAGRFTKAVAADDPLVGPAGTLSPTLLIEAMAQGAGVVLAGREPELRRVGIAVLAAVDHCQVAGTVQAGEVLHVEVDIVRRYGLMARIRGRALVGDRVCATAALTLAFAPNASVLPAGA